MAKFLNRLVFCMFAEDVTLLPRILFTRMLEAARRTPSEFVPMARELFGSMASRGRFGVETVAHFNGGLFTDDDALPLSKTEIETVLVAARLNWSDVDPSILGMLVERGLDPAKRSQLGAHYTDREKVMLIVEPVVVRPLEAGWSEVKKKIAAKVDQEKRQKTIPAARRRRREAERLLAEFQERLRNFTVLDPACGSGNFLFLALKSLKDPEHRVQLEAKALDRGLQRSLPQVGPANVKGIEINPYAAELGRVSPCGSARSSGCAATASRELANRFSIPLRPSSAATPCSSPTPRRRPGPRPTSWSGIRRSLAARSCGGK